MWQQPSPPVMLRENSERVAIRLLHEAVTLLTRAMQLLPETERRERANRRRLAQARPLVAPVRLQDLRLPQDFPVPPARARQYSQCPGPCASSPEILAARKCNREARSGGCPICARYRPPRNRRALAGCDNKCSRSQHKHARRARTFPIVALDR